MQTDQDVEQVIRDYLNDILHMSLATCVNNKPWVCEVHFVYDDELNLYFRSKKSRRHSQEIARNPNVAGNIVEQHLVDTKPRGVYFEGIAETVDDFEKNSPIHKAFRDRLGLDPEIIEDAKNEDGHKLYKITISDLYLFDSRSGPSQKYHLKWPPTA